MKQSTKDNIIGAISGAIVTGIFSFALFYLGNYTNRSTIEKDIVNTLSESFDSIDKDMSYQDAIQIICKENEFLKLTINEHQESIKNASSEKYKLDPNLFNGTWSGTYIGTSNNNKVKREISLYIGMYDDNGNVQGVAEIEEGNFGYYYWEGTVNFDLGVFSFERKKWLSDHQDLKKLKYKTTYNIDKEYFSGYITKDPERTVQFSKAENNEKLIRFWDAREDLIRQYN